MKKQELKTIREKDIAELEKKVIALKKEIAAFYPRMLAGKESNLKVAKQKRREIAQILGIISESKNI